MTTPQKVIAAIGSALLLPTTTAVLAIDEPSAWLVDITTVWTALVLVWTLVCILMFARRD